jgi:hypothetical protein
VGGIVRRQEFCGVHLQPQHVANRIRIFGTVETVHAGRRQIGDRVAIQLLLQVSDHRFHHRRIRTPHARGRHHAGAQLAHHFFPDLGVIVQLGDIELIEHQSSGFQALVVAGNAVLVKKGALGNG